MMKKLRQYLLFLVFSLLVFCIIAGYSLSATARQSTAFQRQQVNVEENNDLLRISNPYTEVTFSKNRGRIALVKMSGFNGQVDFLSSVPSELWFLEFKKNRGRSKDSTVITSLSSDGRAFSSIKRQEKDTTLVLRWEKVSIGGEREALDVEVNVTVKSDEPFAFWRIFVNNRSRSYGLWSIDFPIINLKPIGGNPGSNYLAIGKSRGMLIANPFYGQTQAGHWPGTMNLQFQCLYDNLERGLYLAAYDGGGYQKSFSFKPNKNSGYLQYKVTSRPDNMGYGGENYKMPYSVMIGPFTGDWYAASQIYRNWGIRQEWCKEGPLAYRRDIPRWFKEAPVMLKVTSMKGEEQVPALSKGILDFIGFVGTETPILWYTWKKYEPSLTAYNDKTGSSSEDDDEGPYPKSNIHDGNYPTLPALSSFSPANREISKVGGHVLPYVCAQIYDQGIRENAPYAREAKPNTRKEVSGEIDTLVSGTFWGMCFNTPWWQKRMADTAVGLIRNEKASGIYFDTFWGGYTQCFDTTHGHSYGGGNHSYLGAKAIASRVRREMKGVDTNAVMTGENPSETAIGLLDGFMYKDTIPEGSTAIPLFASVYGDYIVRYGMDVSLSSDDFYLKSALQYLEGCMIGRLPVKENERFTGVKSSSQRSEKLAFLKMLSDYRRGAVGGKYLSYGHLMPPLPRSQAQTLNISYSEPKHHKKSGVIALDALQTAVFRATDGTLGIFVINISEQPATFDFQLPLEKYALSPSVSYEMIQIDSKGMQNRLGTFSRGSIGQRMTIPGHEMRLLSISPMARR